jgi:non-specific protein-tyrosine kinase
MELSAYLIPLRRWWWLLLASTLIAGVSSFIATRNQPPVYQAQTTLMIGHVIDDPNPNQGEINLAQALAQTYADIANREPVRDATRQALGWTSLPQYLARALPQTQFIEIVVTDVDPLRAQVVANELARQLVLRSPTGSEDQDRQQFINNQINILQEQIEGTQDEIATLQEQLGTLNSARQLQDTQTQINALEIKLSTLQGNYAALLANTQQGATNTLTVVEEAGLPRRAIASRRNLSILLSAAIGFSLAAGAAYLLEYLDDTIKTPNEVSRFLDLPVIGLISETGEANDNQEDVYVSQHPRSPITEAYRALRANIEFSSAKQDLRSILIVSSEPDAGKSSVATNLAVIMAQGEKSVVLVDADLHRSSVHKLTKLSIKPGLSDLLCNGAKVHEVFQWWKKNNMWVITSGEAPTRPAELLGTKKMDRIIKALSEKVDAVIIDSPPFIVSDAMMLSTKVDGVIIVVRPGHTRKKIALAMIEQLNRAGARIVGVVLNRIPHRGMEYYGGFPFYSPYYANGQYTSNEIEDAQESTKEKIR